MGFWDGWQSSLCIPIECDNRTALAVNMKLGWGLGVPTKNQARLSNACTDRSRVLRIMMSSTVSRALEAYLQARSVLEEALVPLSARRL